jgi:ATPase subunit of ABC transporter with duplicated ATPase domains
MPPSFQVQDLSFAHGEVPIFDRISFQLGPGFTGLIGRNGAGKTTLLRLLAGELAPTAGAIRRPATVLRCPQVPALDASVQAFAWGWVDGAWALQARLGLDPAQLERWSTLSPGERRRWQIGAALAAEPAGLLLDEPSDHLDADTRAWMIGALRGYGGAAVIAAHDRELLDALCAATLRVDRGAVVATVGGATAALDRWEADRRGVIAALDAASAEVRASRAQLADARRTRDATEATGRTSARMKGPHDSDARTMAAANLASWADTRHGRRVGVTRRAVERAESAHAALERPDDLGGDIAFTSAPGARGRIVAWRGDLMAGPAVLARDLEVVVERGERVRLTGSNGAGKSTLLRALVAAADLPPERVTVLPQELDAERVAAELAALRALPPDARGRALQVVAALGARPERLLATEAPSPGEARKLVLAAGLARGVWWLALDEPTNHLDLPAVAALERALARYDGSIVYVTHEAAFAAAVGGREVRLDHQVRPIPPSSGWAR